jgi:hypothetical protein
METQNQYTSELLDVDDDTELLEDETLYLNSHYDFEHALNALRSAKKRTAAANERTAAAIEKTAAANERTAAAIAAGLVAFLVRDHYARSAQKASKKNIMDLKKSNVDLKRNIEDLEKLKRTLNTENKALVQETTQSLRDLKSLRLDNKQLTEKLTEAQMTFYAKVQRMANPNIQLLKNTQLYKAGENVTSNVSAFLRRLLSPTLRSGGHGQARVPGKTRKHPGRKYGGGGGSKTRRSSRNVGSTRKRRR